MEDLLKLGRVHGTNIDNILILQDLSRQMGRIPIGNIIFFDFALSIKDEINVIWNVIHSQS